MNRKSPPNIQNIVVHTEDGDKIRKALTGVPGVDVHIVGVDWSTAEDRTAMWIRGEKDDPK